MVSTAASRVASRVAALYQHLRCSTIRHLACTAVILALMDFAVVAAYYSVSARTIQERQTSHACDAAIVFFQDFGSDNLLDHETIYLLHTAALLQKQGTVTHIICVGGVRRHRNLLASKHMRDVLVASGVPPSDVFYDLASHDSLTNWQQAYRIIREHQWHRIMLISSAMHYYRLCVIAPPDLVVAVYNTLPEKPGHWRNILSVWGPVHHELFAWTSRAILGDRCYSRLIASFRQ